MNVENNPTWVAEDADADYWILCPFELLRDETGVLRKEYW